MDPIRSSIFPSLQSPRISAAQQPVHPSSQARQIHPYCLSYQHLSNNARSELYTRLDYPPGTADYLLATFAYNGMLGNTLQFQTSDDTEVQYTRETCRPDYGRGKLIIQVKLNNHAKYDILHIALHEDLSAEPISMSLSPVSPTITEGAQQHRAPQTDLMSLTTNQINFPTIQPENQKVLQPTVDAHRAQIALLRQDQKMNTNTIRHLKNFFIYLEHNDKNFPELKQKTSELESILTDYIILDERRIYIKGLLNRLFGLNLQTD